MTTQEMIRVIGKTGILRTAESLSVEVTVLDVRKVYDRIDYQVIPVSGFGQAWVSSARVTMGTETEYSISHEFVDVPRLR